MRAGERTISVLYRAYKYAVSPVLHAAGGVTGACRFQPTCSEYAAIAVSEYGIGRGGWMSFCRLLRCQPFCKGGFDPVRPNPHRRHDNSPELGPRPLR
ncbi:MAG: membrane protein insertion efficiency factor YidD [Acidobacteriaceae bacterium]